MQSTSRLIFPLLGFLLQSCISSIGFTPAPPRQAAALNPQTTLAPSYDLIAEGRMSLRGEKNLGTANFILYLGSKSSLIRLWHPLGPSLAEGLLEESGLTLYLPTEDSAQVIDSHPLFPQKLPPGIFRQIIWGGGLATDPHWQREGKFWKWKSLKVSYPLRTMDGRPRKIRLEAGGYRLIFLIRKLKIGQLAPLQLSEKGKKALVTTP